MTVCPLRSCDYASWQILIIKPYRCTNFSNLFWNSDSSSVHHQEFFTLHTAVVYVIEVCWQLASRIRMEPSGSTTEELYLVWNIFKFISVFILYTELVSWRHVWCEQYIYSFYIDQNVAYTIFHAYSYSYTLSVGIHFVNFFSIITDSHSHMHMYTKNRIINYVCLALMYIPKKRSIMMICEK